MPVEVARLIELPESQCYVSSSGSADVVVAFLQENKGKAYLCIEIAEELNKGYAISRGYGEGNMWRKNRIYIILRKLIKQKDIKDKGIRQKGSFFYYEEKKR